MNIEVTRDNVTILEQSERPHENEYKITTCYFTFDEFTDSFQVKRAIFTILSTGEMYEVDIINNECNIPSEVLKHAYETVKLGVYGYNIGENDELLNRFSPSYAEFVVPTGSYEEGAQSPEEITPSQYDLYSQALQEGLQEVDDKLDEVVETVDGKLEEVDDKLEEVDTTVNNKIAEVDNKLDEVDDKIDEVDEKLDGIETAIEETNNLNLDVSDKVDGDVTVTLTKKDATTKSVVISDGTSLEFNWDGTKLGIKTSDEEEYTYVDLQGIQGIPGPQGEPFRIKKTYSSVAEMNADFNNMEYGDYVMIASSVEVEDNAKLYTRGESQWIFITDFSGATGIRGPVGATPSIQIGTVVSGATPSVTRTGTDENPVLNFVLQKGDKGDKGNIGDTGNGITSIEKTSTSGLVDTYTITFTNGNTTTFDVTNGKGIDRIEKTATVGNIDTYTIYFNDNSTSTFEVANGEVTKEELEEEVDRLSMIYNAFPTTSNEGEEITLDGTAEVPFKKLNLKGNTSQFSTTGKNLLPVTTTGTYTQNGVTFTTNSDGSVKVTGTATNNASAALTTNGYFNSSNIYASSGVAIINLEGDYSYSSSGTNVKTIIIESDTPGYSFLANATAKHFTYTGTARVMLRVSSGDTVNETVYPMLEKGGEYTTYEPYTGNQPAPNPDYPQDIQVVTGNNSIKVEGKNLFDGIYVKLFTSGGSPYNCSYDNNVRSAIVKVKPNTTYTISKELSNRFRIGQYDEMPVLNLPSIKFNMAGDTLTNYTITTENKTEYLLIQLSNNNEEPLTQVELGNIVSEYEPYQSQTYPINIGSIELCKIGDYQDYIYKNNGKWYKYEIVRKLILNGSEDTWVKSSNTTFDRFLLGYNAHGIPLEGGFSNYFKVYKGNIATNLYEASINENKQLVFNFSTYGTTTLTEFKNWLSSHNTELYYVKDLGTTTEITDTTLIEQLDNLEKAYSYDTQTNISQTNADKPFILDVEAILSLKNILN